LRARAEGALVGGLPDERDDTRFELPRDRLDALAGAFVVRRPQVAGAAGRPASRVREPDPEVQESELLVRLEEPRRESGRIQQPPEVVTRIGEVRGRRVRPPARIDPAEDDRQIWR